MPASHPVRLLLGLGNPGPDYEHTRHNAGFDAVRAAASHFDVRLLAGMFLSETGSAATACGPVLFMLPRTFMNESGSAARSALDYFEAAPEHMMVAVDDMNLDPGRIRIRARGSSGGHNGLASLIRSCGTDRFPRLRIGIGMPRGNAVEHVLSQWTDDEHDTMRKAVDTAAAALSAWLEHDSVEKCMNAFN
jgi:PTH1 family peptidyl-tRNA hydrolase